jgi:penicillin-binding protein 1B
MRTRRLYAVAALLALLGASYGTLRVWRYYRHLEQVVAEKFGGRRWELPSRVYSAPFTVYPGVDLERLGLFDRLARLEYVEATGPNLRPGEFCCRRRTDALEIVLRGVPALQEPERRVRLDLARGLVTHIADAASGEELPAIDLEGEPIAGIYDRVWEARKVVTLAEVPAVLVQSVLAAEDRRFFSHGGVDWRAVARALWVNVRAGGVRQGGSTLTQQLMKNFFLTTERTMERKFVELLMAYIAERRYSKLEILETYLNEIYLGQDGARGIFGIGEGARFYFGKEPGDLSPGQMALLAALIRAPNRYAPHRAPERALRRRNEVIARMQRAGMLDDQGARAAAAEPLGLRPYAPAPKAAPYFVDYVREEMTRTYPAEVLTQEGLAIVTALDAQLQNVAERALTEELAALEERHPRLRAAAGEPALEGCLVAIQPQTGEIKAMVGGRRYGTSQFNRAARAMRQVGSLFKPVVYAAALAHPRPDGQPWLPTTRVEDRAFGWEYDGRVWRPANYADEYLGSVTLRRALERSLNAATARVAHQVGLPAVLDMAQRLGIDRALPALPAVVLGAAEATPLEVARTYATLANGGIRPTVLAVRRVVSRRGEVLERRGIRLEPVIAPEIAFMVTHMLRGVLTRGTGRGAALDAPAAGKTGTTDDYRDAWFAGYVPDLVAVVWVGFDSQRAVGLTGAQAALPIWSRFMREATAGRPVPTFRPPSGITLVRIDPASGALATALCPEAIEEAFPVDAAPGVSCPLHPVLTVRSQAPPPARARAPGPRRPGWRWFF